VLLDATPGTYGEAPSGERLPAGLRLGGVVLQIGDLERSVAYYVQVLGLQLASRSSSEAVLTARGDPAPLVTLRKMQGAAPHPQRGRLGLFHFAILLPDRPSLARFVRHLLDRGVHPGAGDHLVSEAFYLTDPDGLGIEVYADRPRSTWRRRGRELAMASDPVDVRDLLRAAGDEPWTGMPSGTVMGHLHLHVRDLESTTAFYSELLGFDRMVWSYPGALFFAAGGYHHHLGTNLWAGASATEPPAGEARLIEWTIELPDAATLDAVRSRLVAAERSVLPDGESVLTRDPSGTPLRLRTRAR
jgi:catechol 2,3-dioxygenase